MEDKELTFEFVQGAKDRTETIYLVYAAQARQVAVAKVRLDDDGYYSATYYHKGLFYVAYAMTPQTSDETFVNTLLYELGNTAEAKLDLVKSSVENAVVTFIRDYYREHKPGGLIFSATVQVADKYLGPVTWLRKRWFCANAIDREKITIQKHGNFEHVSDDRLEGKLVFTSRLDSDEARRAIRSYFSAVQLSLVTGAPEEDLRAFDRVISHIASGHTTYTEATDNCYLTYSISQGEIPFHE